MKLINIAILGAVIVSGSAFATDVQNSSQEKTTIYQSGNTNGADVNQDGAFHSNVYVEQAGTSNYAKDYQSGDYSSITSKQYGTSNYVNVTQTADSSSSYTEQNGVSNWANVYQH